MDVGGVKAAPGPEVPVHQEIERAVPLIAEIGGLHPQIVISVDTWRSAVAASSAEAGAHLINDAWGGYDLDLAKVAVRLGVARESILVDPGHDFANNTRHHNVKEARRVIDMVSVVLGKKQPLIAKRATS